MLAFTSLTRTSASEYETFFVSEIEGNAETVVDDGMLKPGVIEAGLGSLFRCSVRILVFPLGNVSLEVVFPSLSLEDRKVGCSSTVFDIFSVGEIKEFDSRTLRDSKI